MTRDEFERGFADRIRRLTPDEQHEAVLGFAASLLERLSPAQIGTVRAEIAAGLAPGQRSGRSIIELIDGHLAWRELRTDPSACP